MSRVRGSVLVGVLWCLALLSVLVVGVLHRATMKLRVVKNHGDRIQAHYLALAGIEKAKALLYQEAVGRKKSAQNHSGQLYDDPQEFKDVHLGRGVFRVFHPDGSASRSEPLYGVSDEESRLNLNTASAEELARLYQLGPETAASIVDWRDEDNSPSAGGAETEYYASLQPPYLPRNGPIQTTRELLMVRGVSPELFRGEDANLNGLLDPEEDDGDDSEPPDNQDGILESGWSAQLTVHSTTRNVSADGQARVNLQTADESALTGVQGISTEMARGILARRGQNRFENITDLLDVTAASPANPAQTQTPPASQGNSPGGAGPNPPSTPTPASVQQASGPKLISESLFMEIADAVTVSEEREQAGLINVNTASAEVLRCLPGITPELAQAIILYRQSSGFFPNIAWLLKVPGLTRELFKPLAGKVTVRSETFRIVSEGEVEASGARKRIESVVHLGAVDVETLSWREDL